MASVTLTVISPTNSEEVHDPEIDQELTSILQLGQYNKFKSRIRHLANLGIT